MPVCDNIRIRRSRLYPPQATGGAFRGYIASKRRFFYGRRVHLLVTAGRPPVEVTPGAEADIAAFRQVTLDLQGVPDRASLRHHGVAATWIR